MTTEYTVVKAYTDAPNSPIRVSKHERLERIEESDPNGDWPNWVLCKGDNKQGWVPKQILQIEGSSAIVLKDYDAVEHTLAVGDILIKEFELNGWIWSQKASAIGKFAWAPLNHLKAS